MNDISSVDIILDLLFVIRLVFQIIINFVF